MLKQTEYPALAHLLDGWFHQDYDINGDTLEEILPHFIRAQHTEDLRRTLRDIDRFLEKHGDSDRTLSDAVEAVFDPEVVIEGWDGMTTRQWLERVKDLIRRSL